MPNTLVVMDSKISQSADRQTWIAGENPIVFDEPFADINYTLDLHAPDAIVKEKAGTRTVSGVTIEVSTGTEFGYFEATGNSNEYRSAGLVSTGIGANGLIQRGSKVLTQGENTITFPQAFSDAEYTPKLTFGDVHGYLVSRSTTSMVVYSVDDNSDFHWECTGT